MTKKQTNAFNVFDLNSLKSLLCCWFGVSAQQWDSGVGVSNSKDNVFHQTTSHHYHMPLTSSDTSQPMAPGQHSSVLCVNIQVAQPSKEHSAAPSDRLAPPTGSCLLRRQPRGVTNIHSIQAPWQKPRLTALNALDLRSMQSLLHRGGGFTSHDDSPGHQYSWVLSRLI